MLVEFTLVHSWSVALDRINAKKLLFEASSDIDKRVTESENDNSTVWYKSLIH